MKLLRVLEDRKALPMGARTARPLNLRFVAATHRNLEDAVVLGTFRQDLFYRLSGVTCTYRRCAIMQSTAAAANSPAKPADSRAALLDQIEQIERARIMDALAACDGNQTLAAERLGISRRTLVARLAQFNLPRPRKARQRLED